jgi:hypothetical protein
VNDENVLELKVLTHQQLQRWTLIGVLIACSEIVLVMFSVVAGFAHNYKMAFFCLTYGLVAERVSRKVMRRVQDHELAKLILSITNHDL